MERSRLLVLEIAQVILSFALSNTAFGFNFRSMIPQVKVHWLETIFTAVITGVAFTITNYILGIYVKFFTVTTIVGQLARSS